MNNLKKIGLTALGTAMVATSAQAATMSVSGGTSIFFGGEDNSNAGNGWSMTDQVTFSASGEMDNGFTISTSLQLDGVGAAATTNGHFDDRSITIDTGDMGKITFSGHGSSGPVGAWDDLTPTANEEAQGVGYAGTPAGAANGAASTHNIFIYDYTLMDGVALKAGYTPSAGTAAVEGSLEYGVHYTGIDGLDVYAAMGENNDAANAADTSMMMVKYTMGAMSVGYQVNETDFGTGTADEDFTAIGVSYAVSDDLSVSFNSSTIDFEAAANDDQEAQAVSFSHTSGGMTISGSYGSMDNVAGTSTADNSAYEINFKFAF